MAIRKSLKVDGTPNDQDLTSEAEDQANDEAQAEAVRRSSTAPKGEPERRRAPPKVVRAASDAGRKLRLFAQANGNISEHLSESELSSLGSNVVEDFERDRVSTNRWRKDAEAALDAAAQEGDDVKDYPFQGASNVNYPSLTVAAQQFAARAYPAIIKNDEAAGVKVLGPMAAPAVPGAGNMMGHNGGPPLDPQSQGAAPAMPGAAPAQPPGLGTTPPAAPPPPGAQPAPAPAMSGSPKQRRAKRVKDWLNYLLFYAMDDWEGDIDTMLNQIPITGMGFFKVYRKPGYGTCAEYVSAMNLTVSIKTKSLATCPRVTQDYELYPYEIDERIASGDFNDIELTSDSDDDQAPRTILEQYRMEDMDGDGVAEPYIATVDRETQKVLRIEADYGPDDVIVSKVGTKDERVIRVRRWMPFVDFPFLPDPKGRFYAMGFGSLLKKISAVIDTSINQLIDAGHAEIAGGGFIGSNLRLQNGNQTANLKFRPGEYKTVNVAGGEIRNAIYERTLPQPSATMFNLLGQLLEAVKDMTAVKDVLTGEANNNAPVGTTMALIEQALQSFTAIYKRIYRSLKKLFRSIYECEARYGGSETAQRYREFFDGDPEADFVKDFSQAGEDIVPVSDPVVVTKMQQLARAQFLDQFSERPWSNGPAIQKRIYEAADIENPDELIRMPQPSPLDIANLNKTTAEANQKNASAMKDQAQAGVLTGEAEARGAFHAGIAAGHSGSGGVPDMAGAPRDAMDISGLVGAGGSPATGLGGGELGPDALGGSGAGPAGTAVGA